jgi:hypothetical protein
VDWTGPPQLRKPVGILVEAVKDPVSKYALKELACWQRRPIREIKFNTLKTCESFCSLVAPDVLADTRIFPFVPPVSGASEMKGSRGVWY